MNKPRQNRKQRRAWMHAMVKTVEDLKHARDVAFDHGKDAGRIEMMNLRTQRPDAIYSTDMMIACVQLNKRPFDNQVHVVAVKPVQRFALRDAHLNDYQEMVRGLRFTTEEWACQKDATRVRWFNITSHDDETRKASRPCAAAAYGKLCIAEAMLGHGGWMRPDGDTYTDTRVLIREALVHLGEWLTLGWPSMPHLIETARDMTARGEGI